MPSVGRPHPLGQRPETVATSILACRRAGASQPGGRKRTGGTSAQKLFRWLLASRRDFRAARMLPSTSGGMPDATQLRSSCSTRTPRLKLPPRSNSMVPTDEKCQRMRNDFFPIRWHFSSVGRPEANGIGLMFPYRMRVRFPFPFRSSCSNQFYRAPMSLTGPSRPAGWSGLFLV